MKYTKKANFIHFTKPYSFMVLLLSTVPSITFHLAIPDLLHWLTPFALCYRNFGYKSGMNELSYSALGTFQLHLWHCVHVKNKCSLLLLLYCTVPCCITQLCMHVKQCATHIVSCQVAHVGMIILSPTVCHFKSKLVSF